MCLRPFQPFDGHGVRRVGVRAQHHGLDERGLRDIPNEAELGFRDLEPYLIARWSARINITESVAPHDDRPCPRQSMRCGLRRRQGHPVQMSCLAQGWRRGLFSVSRTTLPSYSVSTSVRTPGVDVLEIPIFGLADRERQPGASNPAVSAVKPC